MATRRTTTPRSALRLRATIRSMRSDDLAHVIALDARVFGAERRAYFERRLASLEPAPLVIHGKCVVNVLPPGAITKGDALRALLAITGNPTALYAGDDDTDEHVFELPREQVLGVRVGLRPTTGATMYVDTPADMLPLVDTLIAHWPDGAPRA